MTNVESAQPVPSQYNPWLATSYVLGILLAFIGLVMMISGGKEDLDICRTATCDIPWTDFTPAQITGLTLLVVALLILGAGLLVGAVCWHQANRVQAQPNT